MKHGSLQCHFYNSQGEQQSMHARDVFGDKGRCGETITYYLNTLSTIISSGVYLGILHRLSEVAILAMKTSTIIMVSTFYKCHIHFQPHIPKTMVITHTSHQQPPTNKPPLSTPHTVELVIKTPLHKDHTS